MDKEILKTLVDQGMSQHQIAKETKKGQTTIRYWLQKYQLKTDFCSPKELKTQKCLYCDSEIYDIKHANRTYCNNKCQQLYKRNKSVSEGTASHITLKKHLLETRGIKCEVCGIIEWCEKPVPLVMDHIDGNSENNDLLNLRLVCGNCDMQLPTYKSKNNGKGRAYRRIRYADGKSY